MRRRAYSRFITAASAGAIALGLTLTATPQAMASATIRLAGSSWWGGQGVNVCAPSTDPYCGAELHVGGVSWNWWQCVELAQRFYTARGWHSGTFANVDVAYQIYDNAGALGFTRQAQGAVSVVVPGDMIIENPSSGNKDSGHVAIVESVSGNTINVVEQNASSTGREAYTWSGGTISGGWTSVRGVVHSPKNLTSDRIAAVLTSGTLIAKDGLQGAWVTETGNVKTTYLAGNRIGVLLQDGTLIAKDGLQGAWVTETSNVASAALG